MTAKDFRDYRVGEHDFPEVLRKNGIDHASLHEGVRDIDEWIKRVVKFAKANDIDDYTLQQVEGAAFEHLVECIIKRYGDDEGEVDSLNVGSTRRGAPGIDLIAETHDGKAHLHQCKFVGKKNQKLSMADIEPFDQAEIGSSAGVRKTLWTTANGVNNQVIMNHRGVIHYLALNWLSETLDGDDGFWRDVYAKSLGAEPERRGGLIDEGKLNFTNPDRGYQMKALMKFEKEVAKNSHDLKGRFVYPTGAGKTLIESLILNHQMERNDGFGLHVVVAPRIALLTQLMREYRIYIGDKYEQIGFHSNDSKNEGQEHDKDLALSVQRKTTDVGKVIREIKRARKNDVPLVIFSTYHSLHKLVKDDANISSEDSENLSFETMIADESQYCISRNFFKSVQKIDAKVKLYFTATEHHGSSDIERRNNNEKAFGKILGQEAIQELVDRGILAVPKLHFVLADSEEKDLDIVDVDDEIKEGEMARHLVSLAKNIANKQREIVNDSLWAKTLFSCKSAKHVRIIMNEKNLKMLKEAVPGHAVFTIISGLRPRIDGRPVDRGEFLSQMKNHEGNALIFHYDILAEGIDIDGITGVAILRKTRQGKTLQTIGRCLRPYKEDPALKPHAYVSVPVIDKKRDYSDLVENVVRRMLTCGFDVNSEDIVFSLPDGDPGPRDPGPPRPRPPLSGDIPVLQEEFRFVVHMLKEIKREVREEHEEQEHKVMLTREVTDEFIDDLLSGAYRPEGKPLNKELASVRNRHCIVEEAWTVAKDRIDGAKMRPITPLRVISDHVDRLGDIAGKLTLTFNVEYVPYLKEKGADVILTTRKHCEATKNLAESQVIEARYLTMDVLMKAAPPLPSNST